MAIKNSDGRSHLLYLIPYFSSGSTHYTEMSSTNISFPAPVGGVPFERDFGPSILFSCLYAVLVLAGIYRFARSSSRTTVVLGTFAFVFER